MKIGDYKLVWDDKTQEYHVLMFNRSVLEHQEGLIVAVAKEDDLINYMLDHRSIEDNL